jgi:hypothetical protein
MSSTAKPLNAFVSANMSRLLCGLFGAPFEPASMSVIAGRLRTHL